MNAITPNNRDVTVQIVHGFVDGGAGGNPAGVVLDADGLHDNQMLSIASRIGLSETAFVSKSETEGFKLDFFTPNQRIAHCGHATIAAFSHLYALGRIPDPETSKETVDGLCEAGPGSQTPATPILAVSPYRRSHRRRRSRSARPGIECPSSRSRLRCRSASRSCTCRS